MNSELKHLKIYPEQRRRYVGKIDAMNSELKLLPKSSVLRTLGVGKIDAMNSELKQTHRVNKPHLPPL